MYVCMYVCIETTRMLWYMSHGVFGGLVRVTTLSWGNGMSAYAVVGTTYTPWLI